MKREMKRHWELLLHSIQKKGSFVIMMCLSVMVDALIIWKMAYQPNSVSWVMKLLLILCILCGVLCLALILQRKRYSTKWKAVWMIGKFAIQIMMAEVIFSGFILAIISEGPGAFLGWVMIIVGLFMGASVTYTRYPKNIFSKWDRH